MVEIIDILQQEHRNLEKLLQVMEQEWKSSIEANGRTTRLLEQ